MIGIVLLAALFIPSIFANNVAEINDMFPKGAEALEQIVGPPSAQHHRALFERESELSSGTTTNSTSGFLYMNYYTSKDCSGDVSYVTGVASSVCQLSYSSKYQYESFRIINLSNGCANTQIAYYKDTQCKSYLYTNPVNATYLSCTKTGNTGTQNLLSVRMNCAVGSALPLPATSYVYTEFYNNSKLTASSTTGCASPVNTFNAYPINTCYSYNNYSSAQYMCNSSMVTMNQYYGSKTCQLTNTEEDTPVHLATGCTLTKNVSQALSYVKKYVGVGCYEVSDSSSTTTLSDGAIAGIVVGSVVGAAVIAGVVSFVMLGSGASAGSAAAAGTAGTAAASTNVAGSTTSATATVSTAPSAPPIPDATANPLVLPVASPV